MFICHSFVDGIKIAGMTWDRLNVPLYETAIWLTQSVRISFILDPGSITRYHKCRSVLWIPESCTVSGSFYTKHCERRSINRTNCADCRRTDVLQIRTSRAKNSATVAVYVAH